MFIVYDTGKKADCFNHECLKDTGDAWTNCSFDTLEEAIAYARDWLGMYDSTPKRWSGDKHFYAADCFIEIVEE